MFRNDICMTRSEMTISGPLTIQDSLSISFGNVDFQVFTLRDSGTWKQSFRGRKKKKNPQTPYIFRKKNRRNQRFDCSVWPSQTSLKRWIDICLDHVYVSSSCPHLSSAHLSQTLLPHSLAISCQGQPGPQSCQNWKNILCPCLLLFSKNAP